MTLDSVAARTVVVGGQQRLFISVLDTDGQETDRGLELVLNADGSIATRGVEFTDGRAVRVQPSSLIAPHAQRHGQRTTP